MALARASLIFVGVTSILLALLGLAYNAVSLSTDFSPMPGQVDVPYFYQAFYIMSAICIACYCALIYIGIQLIRGRTNVVRLLWLVVVFELLYFFSLGMLWLMPDYGSSIAAATGVANGGLVVQGLVLFPLWGPLVAYLASRSLQQTRGVQPPTQQTPEPIVAQ